MQELTPQQIIMATRQFVNSCQQILEFPPAFIKKWTIFQHYLNIYPLHSHKLLEYSNKCADSVQEQKFIDDNLLKFAIPQQGIQTPKVESRVSAKKSMSSIIGSHNHQKSEPKQNPPKTRTDTEESEKLDGLRSNLLRSIRQNMMWMQENSNFFKERMKEPRHQNTLSESIISLVPDDQIKRVDAQTLRKRIFLMKQDQTWKNQQMQNQMLVMQYRMNQALQSNRTKM